MKAPAYLRKELVDMEKLAIFIADEKEPTRRGDLHQGDVAEEGWNYFSDQIKVRGL